MTVISFYESELEFMRLDKLLAELNYGTRSQVKELIKKKVVSVDGKTVTSPELQIDSDIQQVCVSGKLLVYKKFQYYVMNKPGGVVSATEDSRERTVISLLPKEARKDLFPVGRLDKDTEGLLILTNDGALSHQLLSPKKHVCKTYLVKLEHALTDKDVIALENGVDIGDEDLTAPAFVSKVHDPATLGEWIHLTITEGRFHQVKRMLEAVGNQVLFLKRIRFGALSLDASLSPGEYRELTTEEVELLRSSNLVALKKQALMSGKKAVIFDMDGTMIDSMWVWAEIDREYLDRFHYPPPIREEMKKAIEGMSFHETALYFKEHYRIPDDVEKMKADWNQMAWDKYENEVPLKAGVEDFLEGCKRRGILLGIATSNSRELVDNVLSVHRVKDLFHSIVTGSEVTKGKPAPDIYLKVAEELGVSPKDCLVFEDILPGLASGKNAGMTTCAVADPDSEAIWEEKKSFADAYVYDFHDFFAISPFSSEVEVGKEQF